MRNVLLIAALFVSTGVFGQSVDSIPVAKTELVRIAQELSTLQQQNKSYQELTTELQGQVKLYQIMKQQDDKLIQLMREEIDLRNSLYLELTNVKYKPKDTTWKQVAWFAAGVVIAYTGVALAVRL